MSILQNVDHDAIGTVGYPASPDLADFPDQDLFEAANPSAGEFLNSSALLAIEITFLVVWSIVTGFAYHRAQIYVSAYVAQLAATGLIVAISYCAAQRGLRIGPQSGARPKLGSLLRVLVCWSGSFLILSFFAFSFRVSQGFSRGAVLTFFFTGLPALAIARAIATKVLAKRLYETSLRLSDSVIVGCSQQALTATSRGISARGCIAPFVVKVDASCADSAWESELSLSIRKTMEFVYKANQGTIYVCAQDFPEDRFQMLLEGLQIIPRSVRIIPNASVAKLLSLRARNEAGGISLEVQGTPLSHGQRLMKRAVDLVVSSALLIVLLPLFAVIAIQIKLDSSGPVIFRQTRLGYRGKSFRIYKFRTMHVLEDGPEIEQAKKDDRRITKVGEFLRKSRIDELPQLINVISGDMSLIGPRPHATAHDKLYGSNIPNYELRQQVLPGITGWAQVNGFHGETPTTDLMRQRIEFDLWYTKNASFALDFEILLRTIAVIFGQESNAAGAGQYQLFRGKFGELLSNLKRAEQRSRVIVTPNLDHYRLLTRSSSFRRAYQNADYIINDSRLLDGMVLRGAVLCAPGSDFVPILIRAQKPGTKVCVIGHTERVEEFLPAKFPDLIFSFIQPSMGYIRNRQERRSLLCRISDFAPNLILVCTGAPQSEIFSVQIKSRKDINAVIVNCGSTLQFLCGSKKRAPTSLRYARAEWLWRFVSEPRTRVRYLLDALFLAISAVSFARLRFGSQARFKGFSLVKKR